MKLRILLLGISSLLLAFQPSRSDAKTGDEKTPQTLSAIPSALSFIENKGQVIDQHNKSRGDIDFKVGSSGMDIFIGGGQIHYQWSKNSRDLFSVPEGVDPVTAREMYAEQVKKGFK